MRRQSEALRETRAEVTALRAERRKWHVHKRVAERTGKQLKEVSARLELAEQNLTKARLARARTEARIEGTEARNVELAASEAALMEERDRTSQEVVGMRLYVQQVEKERRKNEVIERFVRKHETGAPAPSSASVSGRRAHAQTHSAVRAAIRPLRETATHLMTQLRKSDRPELLSASARLGSQLRSVELELEQQAEREGDLTDALLSMQSSLAISNEIDATRAFSTRPSFRQAT